jgi:hypothetical protein
MPQTVVPYAEAGLSWVGRKMFMNLVSHYSSVALLEGNVSPQLTPTKRQNAVVTAWGISPGPITVG